MPEFAGPIKFPVPADRYNTAYGEPQWWKELAETASAAISAKADAGHAHSWAQITGKPTTFEPSAHTHSALSNGTFSVDLSSAGAFALRSGSTNMVQWNASNGNLVAGNVPWARITDKPTAFPPSTHSHAQTDVTGLPAALTTAGQTARWADVSGKPSTYPPEAHTHTGVSNGAFTWSITSAGAIAANAGGSNTWQIDANTGRLIAGNVPWARLTDVPPGPDWTAMIAVLDAAAA